MENLHVQLAYKSSCSSSRNRLCSADSARLIPLPLVTRRASGVRRSTSFAALVGSSLNWLLMGESTGESRGNSCSTGESTGNIYFWVFFSLVVLSFSMLFPWSLHDNQALNLKHHFLPFSTCGFRDTGVDRRAVTWSYGLMVFTPIKMFLWGWFKLLVLYQFCNMVVFYNFIVAFWPGNTYLWMKPCATKRMVETL